mmetsp:Transcript_10465/g.47974  ORF Transcript_10465/g.47974 Transcript_10465/m.47974 type:complete len:216 (-) Transcript_10465:73-720(-)
MARATASTCSRSFRYSALASSCIAFFSSICPASTSRDAARSLRLACMARSSSKTALTRCCSMTEWMAASYSSSRSLSMAASSICSDRSKFTSAHRSFSLSSRSSWELSDTCWTRSCRLDASFFLDSSASTMASSSARARARSSFSLCARYNCSSWRSSAARSLASRARRKSSVFSKEWTALLMAVFSSRRDWRAAVKLSCCLRLVSRCAWSCPRL